MPPIIKISCSAFFFSVYNTHTMFKHLSSSLKKIFFLIITFVAFIFFPTSVQAFAPACAVCVVAIGSGLTISRALGIDDSLVGIWTGALLLSIAGFTGSWIKKHWPRFPAPNLISYVLTYLLTIPFFFIFNLFGQIWWQSNLLFGMIVGTVLLIIGLSTDKFLRTLKPEGKAFFPFQKVIVPIIFLLLGTLITWVLT